jgi:hypothetical protein
MFATQFPRAARRLSFYRETIPHLSHASSARRVKQKKQRLTGRYISLSKADRD